MTLAAVLILAAFLLISAFLLGQLPAFGLRLGIVMVLALFASTAGRIISTQPIAPALSWLAAIGIVTGGIVAAWWVLTPLRWGIDDYFAELDAIADGETEEEPEP